MRGDGRGTRNCHDVPKRLVGDMADIDHDSQPIHLSNNICAEFAQSAVLLVVVVGRIRNVIRQAVRECDVTYASVVEVLKVGKITFNRRAVLHPHRERD